MHQNQLCDGFGGGSLRMDQNLDAGLRFVELRLDGKRCSFNSRRQ